MKAAELLQSYKGGQRDFRGVNLRGQNFKGHDLPGVDFSGADIRSTNFTNANLTGAKFTHAKAGLQRRWVFVLVAFSLLFAAVLGFLSAFVGIFVSALFHPESWLATPLVKVVTLSVFTTTLFWHTRQGIVLSVKRYYINLLEQSPATSIVREVAKTSRKDSTISTIIISLIIVIAIGVGFNDLLLAFTGGLYGSLIASGATVITVSGASIIAIIIAAAGFGALSVAITVAVLKAGVGSLASVISIGILLVSFYLSWRALHGDPRDKWIQLFAVSVASSYGTSFRRATLINTSFLKAILKGADFRGAQLTHADWKGVSKLELARLGDSYLRNLTIRELLLTGNGRKQSFSDQSELQGLNLRNANLQGANFKGAKLLNSNLARANLTNTILVDADLSSVELQEADLSHADLCGANLRNTNLRRANLCGTDLRRTDLRGANLCETNLCGANLNEVNLNSLDLSGANLCGVNLSRTQVLGTSFGKAQFTGACLEDWNINSATNFEDVVCEYVYLQANQHERRPREGTFKRGEFTALFQKAVDTIDLIFKDGIDWQAFFQSFQELRSQYADQNLAIQAIEKKQDSAFIIRLEVLGYIDKAVVEAKAKALYGEQLKHIGRQYQQLLYLQGQQLDDYRSQVQEQQQQNSRLLNIVETMAEKDSASKYDLRGAQFAGGFAETVQGNQIGGTTNNAAAETPALTEVIAEIQNLLKQLEASNHAATEAEQTAYLSAVIPPTRREQFIRTLTATGSTTIKEVTYGAVLKALIERWQRPNGKGVG